MIFQPDCQKGIPLDTKSMGLLIGLLLKVKVMLIQQGIEEITGVIWTLA